MAGNLAEPELLEELLMDGDAAPARVYYQTRGTSISNDGFSKDDEEKQTIRAARLEMALNWIGYGAQVAVSAALFHPFSYAKVLMELGFEPFSPRPSRTLFGKPCLVLPNITSYVRYMKMRDGRRALWTGFEANFSSILIKNLSNDLSYHLIDELVKRTVRRSPRKAWSVFVVPDQEHVHYSLADFMEDLGKETVVRTIGLTLSYPFQVVFLRTAAQFVYEEKVYSGLFDSFLKIYRDEGFQGIYSGYFPRLMAELSSLTMIWISAYVFRSLVTGDRLWLSIFRFAADYISRTLFYPLKLVGRIMAVSPAPLKIVSPPILPKFSSWHQCFLHLKKQNNLFRGSTIFMRVVTTDRQVMWEKYGIKFDSDDTAMAVSRNIRTLAPI